jgi:DNA-directed RNA polymerase specialized sigma24 family protein
MTSELIAGLRPALYRIALRLTDGPHDAQDVLQETLPTVMAKVDTVQDPALLGPWLRRVTVNTALMRLRAPRGTDVRTRTRRHRVHPRRATNPPGLRVAPAGDLAIAQPKDLRRPDGPGRRIRDAVIQQCAGVVGVKLLKQIHPRQDPGESGSAL